MFILLMFENITFTPSYFSTIHMPPNISYNIHKGIDMESYHQYVNYTLTYFKIDFKPQFNKLTQSGYYLYLYPYLYPTNFSKISTNLDL